MGGVGVGVGVGVGAGAAGGVPATGGAALPPPPPWRVHRSGGRRGVGLVPIGVGALALTVTLTFGGVREVVARGRHPELGRGVGGLLVVAAPERARDTHDEQQQDEPGRARRDHAAAAIDVLGIGRARGAARRRRRPGLQPACGLVVQAAEGSRKQGKSGRAGSALLRRNAGRRPRPPQPAARRWDTTSAPPPACRTRRAGGPPRSRDAGRPSRPAAAAPRPARRPRRSARRRTAAGAPSRARATTRPSPSSRRSRWVSTLGAIPLRSDCRSPKRRGPSSSASTSSSVQRSPTLSRAAARGLETCSVTPGRVLRAPAVQ